MSRAGGPDTTWSATIARASPSHAVARVGDARADQPADAAGGHHDADAARVEVEVAHEEEHEQRGVAGEARSSTPRPGG